MREEKVAPSTNGLAFGPRCTVHYRARRRSAGIAGNYIGDSGDRARKDEAAHERTN